MYAYIKVIIRGTADKKENLSSAESEGCVGRIVNPVGIAKRATVMIDTASKTSCEKNNIQSVIRPINHLKKRKRTHRKDGRETNDT